MTTALGGVRSVKRVEIPSRPSIYLFAVERRDRGPLYVVWERRDAFTGEDLPPVPFDFASAAAAATATDALGKDVPVQVANGKIHLAVSLTPIFIELSR
jgi:hypothetical protein